MSTRDISPSPNAAGNDALVSTMLSAIVAVDDGEWIDVLHFSPGALHVQGITDATIELRGSNQPLVPDNDEHGVLIGAALTADGLIEWVGPVHWIKARVSVWVSGTISAWLVVHGNN